MVELPLALPVIMAGIRTAAVWVIGTATLSTPIGQTSLGNYIFTGLQTQNWVFVLFGCVAAAALALLVDQLLALIETGAGAAQPRRASRLGALRALLLLVGGAGCRRWRSRAPPTSIGAKPFAEQYVLAALIEQRLRAARASPRRTRDGLGSSVIFDALTAGEIDVYVDYTGTIWANQMQRTRRQAARRGAAPRSTRLARRDARDRDARRARLRERLRAGDADATRRSARRPHDRRPRGPRPRLVIAGDYEFFARPEWAALRKAYGLNFASSAQMQPEFMYRPRRTARST